MDRHNIARHAETFTLKDLRDIRLIDEEGLWVKAYDSNGNEIEVVINGLTRGTLADYMRNNPPEA
jgi:hypothetical protein